MASRGSEGERDRLDRGRIVAAAVELADGGGVEALTMRNLASLLGYKVMSLYNHVDNKDELLALVVDAVAAEIEAPPADLAPLAAVRRIAVSNRAVLVRHPWAPGLWLRYLPGPHRSRVMELLLRDLSRSGLSPDLAHHGFHAVTNHVLGYTLQEQGMDLDIGDDGGEARAREFMAGLVSGEFPHTIAHVHQHLDGETASSFELVLDLILDGLVRLDAAR